MSDEADDTPYASLPMIVSYIRLSASQSGGLSFAPLASTFRSVMTHLRRAEPSRARAWTALSTSFHERPDAVSSALDSLRTSAATHSRNWRVVFGSRAPPHAS
jgi:hypothetical protein